MSNALDLMNDPGVRRLLGLSRDLTSRPETNAVALIMGGAAEHLRRLGDSPMLRLAEEAQSEIRKLDEARSRVLHAMPLQLHRDYQRRVAEIAACLRPPSRVRVTVECAHFIETEPTADESESENGYTDSADN